MNRFVKVLLNIFVIIIIVLSAFWLESLCRKHSDNPDVVSFAKLNPLITNEAYYVKLKSQQKLSTTKVMMEKLLSHIIISKMDITKR